MHITLIFVSLGVLLGSIVGIAQSFFVNDRRLIKPLILGSLLGYGGGIAIVDLVLAVSMVLFAMPWIYVVYVLSFNLFVATFWVISNLVLALLS